VRHDLLSIPWPFPDGAFDLVYASHVLEHVPPIVVERDGVKRDVLFLVFEEIHRVLKPGGRLALRVPWGSTQAALSHIQHYRQFRPEWLHYFHPEHEERHYSRARFVVERWRRTRGTTSLRAPYSWRIRGLPLTQHLAIRLPFLRWLLEVPSELDATLRKV